MTNIRRLLASCLLPLVVGGLGIGCSSTGPYSAGRLPYGGDQKLANHDPFAGVSQEKPRTGTDRANSRMAAGGTAGPDLVSWNQNRATTPEDYSTPPAPGSNWAQNAAPQGSHQTAYFEQAPGREFTSRPQALQPLSSMSASPYMPVAANEPNPFAVVAGPPMATTPMSAPTTDGRTTSYEYAAPTGDAWYTDATAHSSSGEVFLPPIR